ncbi:unnamed protein product [Cercospora beticola]|nr:unnamed protein product [Cercospora beticola]
MHLVVLVSALFSLSAIASPTGNTEDLLFKRSCGSLACCACNGGEGAGVCPPGTSSAGCPCIACAPYCGSCTL